MSLKRYVPVTPGQRGLINIDRSHLWKGRPIKSESVGKISTGGRNNFGRTTSWNISKGHKKLYRNIDFKRNYHDVSATVIRIEYDPNRTGFIALIRYESGKLSYILCPDELKIGDKVMSSLSEIDAKIGNSMKLQYIPIGSLVHNVEIKTGSLGVFARSAGSYAKVISKSENYAKIELKSSEVRMVHLSCKATIGIVSNLDHHHKVLAKAGRNRWLGRKPKVRGVAMNPIDHPHGGGQGKTSGGRIPVTPWGKNTKGKKTRHNKRTQKFITKNRKK